MVEVGLLVLEQVIEVCGRRGSVLGGLQGRGLICLPAGWRALDEVEVEEGGARCCCSRRRAAQAAQAAQREQARTLCETEVQVQQAVCRAP